MKSEVDPMWYAIDFETSDVNRYSCVIDRVCVLEFDIGTMRIVDKQDFCFRGGTPDDINLLKSMVGGTANKVAHNAAYELYLMENRLGIPINGELHDTYLMAKHWRNDLPAYDLKTLAWLLFGDLYTPLTKLREWIHKHNLKGEDDVEFDMTRCPDKLVHDYCMHDVKMTAKIAHMLYKELEGNYAYEQDAKFTRFNSSMESNGITADVDFYRRFISLGNRRIKRNTKCASASLGITDGKRKPTGNALRDHLKAKGENRRTASGLTKANDVVLRDHRDSSAVRAVQRIRTDQKQVNTYAANIMKVVDEDGKFHPNLMQSAAITRRHRSANMYGNNGVVVKGNVQNFPRGEGIRTGIITPPGFKLAKMDLASIEARLGAHAMSVFLDFDFYCKKYQEDDSFNIYLYVVKEHTSHGDVTKKDPIYTAYKHACLGIQYGVGINTFHKTLVDNFQLDYTLSECESIYKTIRRKCPEFTELQRRVGSIISQQGYITDDFGAVYYVPEDERYKGVNYYCQGCAGNVLKWWGLELTPCLKGGEDYPFNLVHDEIDMAMKDNRGAQKRLTGYCDLTKGLDLFDLPIIAEDSGLVDNWAEAG